MDALLQAQISIILAFQQFTFLTTPMDWLSRLGYEEFFIALIPVIYLGLDANTGARLALVLLLGDSFNWALKMAFHAPRPYWIDSRVQAFHFARDYGLPSGHAQNATGVWFFLASALRKKWMWVAAGVIVFLISLSRVYLGVHFITDVAGGWMFGGAFLFTFLWAEPKVKAWLNRAEFRGQVMAATVVAAAIVVVGLLMRGAIAGIPDPESWASFAAEARRLDSLIVDAGAFFGLGIGLAMAREIVVVHKLHGILLDGTPLEAEATDVFRFREGRIASMRAYEAPEEAFAAAPLRRWFGRSAERT